MLITLTLTIQAMLVWLTLPFCDFCGFRSVAVNSVYKLQFFTFMCNKSGLINLMMKEPNLRQITCRSI